MRTRYSNISCARVVIESGDYDYFIQHVQKCSDNSRAATNRVWCLIERIRYLQLVAGAHVQCCPPAS